MRRTEAKEIIGILRDCVALCGIVQADYKKDEEILIYVGGLKAELKEKIKKLEKKL